MTVPLTVTVKRGSLYLKKAVYDRYFPGLEAVILVRRDDDLLILPVRHAASGGYLLKIRNGVGDRVVTAPDFFREQGFDEDFDRELPVIWSPEKAALLSAQAFV
jgi:hypothetical protein